MYSRLKVGREGKQGILLGESKAGAIGLVSSCRFYSGRICLIGRGAGTEGDCWET